MADEREVREEWKSVMEGESQVREEAQEASAEAAAEAEAAAAQAQKEAEEAKKAAEKAEKKAQKEAEAAEKRARKVHAGDIKVTIEEEKTIWYDRKRVTIFALPWSFTRYRLTHSKLILAKGFWTIREDEIRLYRIRDVAFTQTLGERMNGTGTLTIKSSDASVPEIKLIHIKNARKVKEIISQQVEICRRENGVHASELIGNGPVPHQHNENCDHDALGPEILPDVNGNGIPDSQEDV